MPHEKKRIAETSQPQGSLVLRALSKPYEISREVAADGHAFDGAQPTRRFSRRTLLKSVGGLAAAGAGVAIIDHFTGGGVAKTVGAIQDAIGTNLHPASPGNHTQTQASIVVTSRALETSSSSTGSTISSSASTPSTNKLYFYYDSNLNNKKDESEPLLNGLYINQEKKIVEYHDGYIEIPKNSKVQLTIGGNAPNGKALTTFTSLEPTQPGLLPDVEISSLAEDLYLGLADGPATSPIKPSELNIADMEYWRTHPGYWKQNFGSVFPPDWPYEPNYYAYGYSLPIGSPHRALDIWAPPGTPVHATWGGSVLSGPTDDSLGIINKFGVILHAHINPEVHSGDIVSRYDQIGTIANGEGNHVHVQFGMEDTSSDAANILTMFTTMKPEDILKNPLKGEPVPILPYFGP